MDVVTDTANTLVRQSTSVLQAAAGELAKQATAVAQLAQANDTIAWFAGEDDEATQDGEFPVDDIPAPVTAMPIAALQSWGSDWRQGFSTQTQEANANDPERRRLPYTYDAEVNAKIFLLQGDVCAPQVDVLLTPTAAGYAIGASATFHRVLQFGGRDLRADLEHLEPCRSGEVRFTKAYNLPCIRLALTVGPKFKEKYPVAAQNMLNACYRECMQGVVEHEFRTVAIPCSWYQKGYPTEDQAHVALRTLRRCLEKLRRRIDAVVMVAASPGDLELYETLMPLYFPRSVDEAAMHIDGLPDCCWTEWGEVTLEERRIRLSSCLMSRGESEDSDQDDRAPIFSPSDDADKGFLQAKDDADTTAMKRLEGTVTEAETPDMARHACLRYLRRAREMRSEHEATRFVFRAGQDRFGRKMVVLLGARLPPLGVRDERTLPLFVKELEMLGSDRFALLYVNSNVSALDTSKLEVFQEMLAVISMKYRNSLDQVLVLHPDLWFRAAFAMGRAVSDIAASVWHDTVYLERLENLANFHAVAELQLPTYVQTYDAFS
mmetsp:Transcript_29441/g.57636  ORF Transcript_29441/g.57636 Transcript_29441/m.57636 type:complete len:548 (-) Transcript_29441:238-1881(-)|eukprot:CAMPEP_0172681604 /NCGR_PEP_ID=MMETSP1074-20121228/17568_1 /TAXON_ID=2916 /ORGANISM="Ceratium fusus, Strain PA161109" /LENGTH=547 /DNA_ID=CAMNT_0013500133 /DNA_START=63 /DNA_END=1706 /DNA_ORIENTATION=+